MSSVGRSRKLEMSSVGQPQADTMGLPGLLGLWILGRKYMTGVRGVMEMCFLAVSVRKFTIGDESVDGVGDGGLMSGCQIPVNPTIKSSVS